MANGVSITIDSRRFTGKLANLVRPALDNAVALSLVDTAKTGIVQASKAIRARTGIKTGVIKDRIFYDPVNTGDYRVYVKSSTEPVPLRDFPGTRQTSTGIQTRAWGKQQIIPHGFTVERFGGHAYVRKGRQRFPIKKLFGPHIGGTFALRDVQGVVGDAMTVRLQKALARRMAAAARRQGK